jgi:acetyl esterase/lipase
VKKWLLRLARLLTLGLATVGAVVVALWWYYHPAVTRTDGVVYGRRDDRSLTMDVFRPARPNGRGVAFLVSGGWKSKGPGEAPTWPLAPLLRRGYTVFAVCHVSQPEATVMDIVDDMHRALRFIRHHAAEYGVDPQRLGVSGGSAGGHLSLMLATRGGPGDPAAADPVDRASSAVQAVAIFYPVTDLLDLDGSTEDAGDGGPPKSFVRAFGPDATDRGKWPEIGKSCSPLHWITGELPPTLIYHGDADTLTPLNQSLRFQRRAADYGREVQVVVHPGGGHGWLSMVWDVRRFADWFDQHL